MVAFGLNQTSLIKTGSYRTLSDTNSRNWLKAVRLRPDKSNWAQLVRTGSNYSTSVETGLINLIYPVEIDQTM